MELEFPLPGVTTSRRRPREHKWNLEDAARRLRYAFFQSAAGQSVESAEGPARKQANLARVTVAHSADDQAETVLARLLRGTGPRKASLPSIR